MKIGIITQARTASTRLPNKILLFAGRRNLLANHISRLQQSGYPIYVATTDNSPDKVIADFCKLHELPCYRGSEANVLERYYKCALSHRLDVIVRVTSDCPLIDGGLIRRGIEQYLALNDPQAYLSNGIKRTFPRGFDLEIFSFALLTDTYLHAVTDWDKEHVTPYIQQNKSGKVNIHHLLHTEDKSQYRLTVDTQEDYELIARMIELYSAHLMDYREIIDLLDKNPYLHTMNADVQQKQQPAS